MSILWALTGNLDDRLTAGRVSEVARDCNRVGSTAEVTLHGRINHIPFEITRERSSKNTKLTFRLDDKDCTQSTIQLTQACVDEVLGISNSLLRRCCFFMQHSHSSVTQSLK